MSKPCFVLVGNGPVTNRGCQAIVLGTRLILQREFGDSDFLLASFARDSANSLPGNGARWHCVTNGRAGVARGGSTQASKLLRRPEDKSGFLSRRWQRFSGGDTIPHRVPFPGRRRPR